jgi:hypothetical protein
MEPGSEVRRHEAGVRHTLRAPCVVTATRCWFFGNSL